MQSINCGRKEIYFILCAEKIKFCFIEILFYSSGRRANIDFNDSILFLANLLLHILMHWTVFVIILCVFLVHLIFLTFDFLNIWFSYHFQSMLTMQDCEVFYLIFLSRYMLFWKYSTISRVLSKAFSILSKL